LAIILFNRVFMLHLISLGPRVFMLVYSVDSNVSFEVNFTKHLEILILVLEDQPIDIFLEANFFFF
jgi:hypothetical protein